jgi:CheY-like chemotaxis protein
MIYRLGPRAQRIYAELRGNISSGHPPAGTRFPSHTTLAKAFGVAELTIRSVLAQLENDGLVSREQGRGTFVRDSKAPNVLIVDDDPVSLALVRKLVKQIGECPIEASDPEEALSILEREHTIAFVLSDVRMPTSADGIGLMRTVHRRWPEVVVAAITSYPDDLADMLGTPECPVVVLSKPVNVHRLELALRLGLGRSSALSA